MRISTPVIVPNLFARCREYWTASDLLIGLDPLQPATVSRQQLTVVPTSCQVDGRGLLDVCCTEEVEPLSQRPKPFLLLRSREHNRLLRQFTPPMTGHRGSGVDRFEQRAPRSANLNGVRAAGSE